MATICPTTLRHLAGRTCKIRPPQRRWAKVHDVRFVATHGAQSRILEQYKQKLEQKAKAEGLSDISQLKEAYKDKITTLRKTALVPGATAPLTPPPSPESLSSSQPLIPPPSPTKSSPWPAPPRAPTPQIPKSSGPAIKTLSSYLDVPKTLELPASEIQNIWRLRHASNPRTLCASLPASTFTSMARTARRHPQFILPGLPREPDTSIAETGTEAAAELAGSGAGSGAHIHFLQWTFPSPDTATVIFTHLAEYKLRGEFASPHTTVTHHLELAGEKGIVLAQGQVLEGRGVSVDEAKWLIMCLQKFYSTAEEAPKAEAQVGVAEEMRRRRRRLMEMFSKGDQSFRIEELVEEAERIG